MALPWIFCGAGLVFCITGIIFFKNAIFEEGRSINWSVVIMIMGVVLIGIGTAKFFGLSL